MNRIEHWLAGRFAFGFNPYVVFARRDLRQDQAALLAAFAPRPVTVRPGVIAHFASHVPSRSRVAIDEREIEVHQAFWRLVLSAISSVLGSRIANVSVTRADSGVRPELVLPGQDGLAVGRKLASDEEQQQD